MITYLTRFKTCFFYNNTIKNFTFNDCKMLIRDTKYSFYSKLSIKTAGISKNKFNFLFITFNYFLKSAKLF
jgi:hypothetical protein